MSSVAIIGAGPLGGALAHTLAARGSADEVRLIDPYARVAEGKALDIMEASPIEAFGTRVRADTHLSAAAGATVVVFADLFDGGEIAGESGLALLRDVVRLEPAAPLLFAGASQRELIGRAVGELHVPARRVVGSAPLALESAVRAVAAVMLDGSAVDVSLAVYGVPPRSAVIAWESATVSGQPIASRLPAHQMATLSSRLPGLWPPGPYGLASAAAVVAGALTIGTRRRLTCFAAIDVSSAGRNPIAAVPVDLAPGGIAHVREPALSRQERTLFENGLTQVSVRP
ncbi:MAG TPA: hypothetical protein VFX12_02115 [Vicinamibacterales bacterium]|nr:hypothetical protein [Vicinamibacterales bacterium]